jgi:hypothetical protein
VRPQAGAGAGRHERGLHACRPVGEAAERALVEAGPQPGHALIGPSRSGSSAPIRRSSCTRRSRRSTVLPGRSGSSPSRARWASPP